MRLLQWVWCFGNTVPIFMLKCILTVEQDTNGSLRVKQSHPYYYQIQAQIYICHATYCDFVAWSEADVVVLRINPCDEFIKSAIEKATEFFKYCILPELFGKWYSKAPLYCCKAVDSGGPLADITSSSSQNSDVTSKRWCFCRSEEAELMIGCDIHKSTHTIT